MVLKISHLIFGEPGDIPLVGNFDDSDEQDEVAVYRPSNGKWQFSFNVNGGISKHFTFGGLGEVPFVGDFDGDGQDGAGIYRPSQGKFFFDDDLNGKSDKSFTNSQSGDIPFVGNFDADASDEYGVFVPSTGEMKIDLTRNGGFNTVFTFGQSGDIPFVGNFDADAEDDVGFIRPGSSLTATASITATDNEQLTEGAAVDVTLAPSCDDDEDNDGVCDEWVTDDEGSIEFGIGGTTYTYECRPLLVDNDPDTATEYTGGLTTGDVCPKNERKQIFIENDYMTGHKPPQQSWEDVINAFAAANNANDDGSTGIDLFVTVDEDWGKHEIQIPFNGTDADPGFDQFKKSFFGSSDDRDRADADSFLTGARQHIRYMADIHTLEDSPLASGYSEIGGNDATINGGVLAGNTGSVLQLGATKMHEIGHWINLNHGGFDDINCKPNYLSVMNYLFQFDDNLDTRPLDFSRSRLADLDETGTTSPLFGLSEPLGITESVHPTAGILKTVIGGDAGAGVAREPFDATTGTAINYNQDVDSTDTGVAENISFFDISDCKDAPTLLEGYNDWSSVNLIFRDQSTFADGKHTLIESVNEINQDEIDSITIAVVILQVDSIIDTLEDPATGFTGTDAERDAIVTSLETVKADVTNEDFDIALGNLPSIRTAIVDLGLTDPQTESELLDIMDFLIQLLDSVVTAAAEHNNPTANDQTNIIDNLDPFEILLTGGDPNGDALTFEIVIDPLFGTLTGFDENTGVVSYTPDAGAGFVDVDTFTFKVTDELNNESSVDGTVLIVLNQIPIADDQTVILEEGTTSQFITLTGQDNDALDEFTFLITGGPNSGTLGSITPSLDGRSATVEYFPANPFTGLDSFTFKIHDGTQDSESVTVKIIVAGLSVNIFDEHPKIDKKTGEPKVPAIKIDQNKSIHIIIDGTTIDVNSIKLDSVFFGPAGAETDGAQGIHINDENFVEKHIKDFETDDGLLVHGWST